MAISVTAVADAPINTVPGAQTVAEDTPLTITGISVSDAEGDLVSTQLSVNSGTLDLTAATGATLAGDGTKLSGPSPAHKRMINATLANPVIYQGTADFNGNDTLTVLSTDNTSGTALTDSDTVAISVTAVADAPINTVPGAQTVGDEDYNAADAITGICVSGLASIDGW